VIGYDEVNLVAAAMDAAGSTEPDAIIEQLAQTDYTGISGHVVMDPETRRADKPAALIQMDGTEFTCLGQPDFPSYVPPAAA
jgi:branched-chain amino acid transport system substrate-binding protein